MRKFYLQKSGGSVRAGRVLVLASLQAVDQIRDSVWGLWKLPPRLVHHEVWPGLTLAYKFFLRARRCLKQSIKTLLLEPNDICRHEPPTSDQQEELPTHSAPGPPQWTSALSRSPGSPTLLTVDNSRTSERSSCGELASCLPCVLSFHWPRKDSSY